MTSPKIKILAISGSTRSNSSNFKILKYVSNCLQPDFEVEIFEDLESLPHFNPDLDTAKSGLTIKSIPISLFIKSNCFIHPHEKI